MENLQIMSTSEGHAGDLRTEKVKAGGIISSKATSSFDLVRIGLILSSASVSVSVSVWVSVSVSVSNSVSNPVSVSNSNSILVRCQIAQFPSFSCLFFWRFCAFFVLFF